MNYIKNTFGIDLLQYSHKVATEERKKGNVVINYMHFRGESSCFLHLIVTSTKLKKRLLNWFNTKTHFWLNKAFYSLSDILSFSVNVSSPFQTLLGCAMPRLEFGHASFMSAELFFLNICDEDIKISDNLSKFPEFPV